MSSTTIDAPWRGSNYLQGFKNGYLAILNSGKKWPLFKLSVVYFEASFTIKNTGEHKTIEVKINEDLIPWGRGEAPDPPLRRNHGTVFPLHTRSQRLKAQPPTRRLFFLLNNGLRYIITQDVPLYTHSLSVHTHTFRR